MAIPMLLLGALEDLGDEDFHKFKWFLSLDNLDGLKPIPKSRLENASRSDTVTKMIESYRQEPAVNITITILRNMNLNNTAEELASRYSGGNMAAPSASVAAPPAAAPAMISAQNNSVLIAPSIVGSTAGSVNIYINK